MVCGHHLQNHFVFTSLPLLLSLSFVSKQVKQTRNGLNGLRFLTGQTVGLHERRKNPHYLTRLLVDFVNTALIAFQEQRTP